MCAHQYENNIRGFNHVRVKEELRVLWWLESRFEGNAADSARRMITSHDILKGYMVSYMSYMTLTLVLC